MTKHTVLCVLGLGLAGAYGLRIVPPAAAEPVAEASPANSSDGGTTTYFPPAAPNWKGPATTGALPDTRSSATAPASPSPAPASTATAPVSEPPSVPATGAVTPPASEPATANAAPSAAPAPASPPSATGASNPTAPATETAVAPPPPPPNPVVEAARRKLDDGSLGGRDNVSQDVAAATAFYAARSEPLWTKDGAYTDKAKSIVAELRKADDWGLESSDFVVPDLASGAGAEAQGAAEVQLTLAALKYARFARGGRLDPVSLSNILDMQPPVKDAKVVLAELADASSPDAYLRGLNPKHAGFEALRQALLKARGPKQEEEPIDPALLVKLPDAKPLKPGASDDQIALLRQRLKIPADQADQERVYDDRLVDAVRDVQQANGLKANGILSNRVRSALNAEGQPKKADPSRNIDRLIVNMERWRWLPTDLGNFYVMNNIPEFTSEIWKGNDRVLQQKMIVGQPSWPTPVLKASMQFVIFHPSWGMPDGIKAKELLPRLRSASSSGFDFFDQLFGGGSSGASRVIEAYKLQVYYNGHPVDPNSVNWNTADMRQYSFTQPPGADNPLGLVKFRFPNSHDVYMHDTPQRDLFGQTFRALSHGCMRVEQPRKTAEVILAEDKGYSPEKVGELWDSGASVTLDKQVPVYLVYFTARVDQDGRMQNYADIYGNDDRVMSALRGHPVRYTAPQAIDPTESDPADQPPAAAKPPATVSDAGSDDLQDAAPPPAKKSKNGKKAASNKPKSSSATAGDTLQNALNNIFLN